MIFTKICHIRFFPVASGGVFVKISARACQNSVKHELRGLNATLLLLIVYKSFSIISLGCQSAAVPLCMYQALQKPGCSVASLCSGPETGLTRWVRNKKNNRKRGFFFFIGALLFSSVGLSSRSSSKCRLT